MKAGSMRETRDGTHRRAQKIPGFVQQPLFIRGQRPEALAVDLVQDAIHLGAQVAAVLDVHAVRPPGWGAAPGGRAFQPLRQFNAGRAVQPFFAQEGDE